MITGLHPSVTNVVITQAAFHEHHRSLRHPRLNRRGGPAVTEEVTAGTAASTAVQGEVPPRIEAGGAGGSASAGSGASGPAGAAPHAAPPERPAHEYPHVHVNPTENPHKVTRFFRIHEIVKRIWGSFAVLIDTARKSVTPVDEEEAVDDPSQGYETRPAGEDLLALPLKICPDVNFEGTDWLRAGASRGTIDILALQERYTGLQHAPTGLHPEDQRHFYTPVDDSREHAGRTLFWNPIEAYLNGDDSPGNFLMMTNLHDFGPDRGQKAIPWRLPAASP